MFFMFGFFDGRPVKQYEKWSRCGICGYEGNHCVYKARRWLLLLFIPIPVSTRMYTECPRCGHIEPVTVKNQ